jgi:preprotein translocase subunit SecA
MHVLTANDYLAARDARWMGPVFEALGLRAASIGERTPAAERREAYRADVLYLTAREAGFDYLRDGMAARAEDLVQGDLDSAIVDEADFILVDEARIPLVIAGAMQGDAVDVHEVDGFVAGLQAGTHFTVDREGRRVSLTLEGHREIERSLGVAGIHEEAGARLFARIHAALHARWLLARDVDYVVKSGRVEMVDSFTGRIADRRQWPWGIQAALEARESLQVRVEGTAFGTITVQHFMGLYRALAAMTATAASAAEELSETYGLSTVIVPTVKPSRRVDLPDRVFRTRAARLAAVAREVQDLHAEGRPVLVGTATVQESQELADLLDARGLSPRLLNAKNDEREAELIAEAGRLGAVTISTNMAGRGTDIRLAGPGGEEARPAEHARLTGLGGLAVIGTSRHESRRVDDQLRGRAGRQGEPGSTRFFVSLEDPLFERHGVREFLPRSVLEGDAEEIGDPRAAREIRRAQLIIEAQNHAIRRTLRKYSQLVELDRRAVRSLRDEALRGGRLPPAVEEACAASAGRGEASDLRSRAVQAWIGALDAFWADHLALVEEVREGIHLERLASRDPGLEYIRRVGDAFLARLADVEERTADACRRAAGDPSLLSAAAMGISRPSSTWTYQVDDESPVGPRLSAVGSAHVAAAIASGVVQGIATLARLPQRLLGRLAGLLPGRGGGRRGGGRRGGTG